MRCVTAYTAPPTASISPTQEENFIASMLLRHRCCMAWFTSSPLVKYCTAFMSGVNSSLTAGRMPRNSRNTPWNRAVALEAIAILALYTNMTALYAATAAATVTISVLYLMKKSTMALSTRSMAEPEDMQ